MKFALLTAAVLCIAATLPGDDAATIAAQKPLYALTTCPVSGETLGGGGMKPKDILHDGQLVELCCGNCKADFEKKPAEYMKKVQDAAADAQRPAYPLDTCVVSGEKLGDKPVSVVVASKLVQLCCGDCKKDLLADPAKYTAKLDQAYMDKQSRDYPLTTCPMSNEELGAHPVKLLHGTTLVEFCCKDCVADFQANPKPTLDKLAAARATKPAPAKTDEKPMAPAGHSDHSGH
jgi:hypothetical protein